MSPERSDRVPLYLQKERWEFRSQKFNTEMHVAVGHLVGPPETLDLQYAMHFVYFTNFILRNINLLT